jgi:hypothetical protein
MTDDLSRRLVELERELADVRAQLEQASDSPLSSRRNLLRVATAAAVGATAAGFTSRSAAADTGDELILGEENTADAVTGIHNNDPTFTDLSGPGPIALRLTSAGGHLQFVGTPGDTVLGTYPVGTLAYNSTSGLELWQPHGISPDPRPTLLARPGTAGALTLLFEPVRVYDSRPGATPDLPNDGRISTGQVRTIGLLDSGAEGFIENIVGVMMNLTVTNTVGFGFLTVFAADIAVTPNVSSINWFEDGMTVANHVVSAVDLAQLKVACGGGGSTHFIIDVIGVYG